MAKNQIGTKRIHKNEKPTTIIHNAHEFFLLGREKIKLKNLVVQFYQSVRGIHTGNRLDFNALYFFIWSIFIVGLLKCTWLKLNECLEKELKRQSNKECWWWKKCVGTWCRCNIHSAYFFFTYFSFSFNFSIWSHSMWKRTHLKSPTTFQHLQFN